MLDDDDASACASVPAISSVSRARAFGAQPGGRLVEEQQARLRRPAPRRSPARGARRRTGACTARAPCRPGRRAPAPRRPRRAPRRRGPGRASVDQPRSRTAGSAIRTLSMALSSSNRFMIWNERDMPLRAICARRQAGDVLAGEADAAAVGPVAAGQHVEAGGLAGAVGAHDAGQLAFLEGQRDVLQHHLVAEALVQAAWPRTAPCSGLLGACRRGMRAAGRGRAAPRAPGLPGAGHAFGLEQHHGHEQQARTRAARSRCRRPAGRAPG